MAAKRATAKRRPGSPHRKVRRSCKWCTVKRHNHTSSGNTCRFHKTRSNPNPFCSTHKTTKIGRLYCKGVKTKR